MKNEVKPEAKPSAAQSDSASNKSNQREKYDTQPSEDKYKDVVGGEASKIDDATIKSKLAQAGPARARLIAAAPDVISKKGTWDHARTKLETAEAGIEVTVGMISGVLKATDAGGKLWSNCERWRTCYTVNALYEKLPSSEIAIPAELLAQFNAEAPAVIAAGKAADDAKDAFEKAEANFTSSKDALWRLLLAIPALVRAYKIEHGLLRSKKKAKSKKSGPADGSTPPVSGEGNTPPASGEGATPPVPPAGPPASDPGGGATAVPEAKN